MANRPAWEEEFEQWVQAHDKGKRAKAEVDFLKVRDQVQTLCDRGYSVITVWQFLSDQQQVACGYATFRKYVRKYIDKSRTPTLPEDLRSPEETPRTRTRGDTPRVLPQGPPPRGEEPEAEEMLERFREQTAQGRRQR